MRTWLGCAAPDMWSPYSVLVPSNERTLLVCNQAQADEKQFNPSFQQ
jgi:hypothetical protein